MEPILLGPWQILQKEMLIKQLGEMKGKKILDVIMF